MKKIIQLFLLSCLKATELIEKKMNFKLTAREKLQLSMHKMVCNACRNYEKQSTIIETGMLKQFEQNNQKIEIDVDSFKKSILDKIEK
jgi:hypothetical protein